MKKYIGDKAFYKAVLLVTMPIMIQNGITNFVSLIDNIMIGSIGTEQMTGVSIVNQLIFVFGLCIFGAMSGAGIFTAQFYGKKDKDGMRSTLQYKLVTSILIAISGAICACIQFFLYFPIQMILFRKKKEDEEETVNQ